MSDRSSHEHEVRRVTLPSGRTIEVLYFEGAPQPAATPELAPDDGLHVCRDCASQLVYPVEWEPIGETPSGGDDQSWRVTLRCPNCETVREGEFDQVTLDGFDQELDRGTQTLIGDLRQLARANMEDQVERFVKALREGHILPADF